MFCVGGALLGPLGGKLAPSVLGDVLPDIAVQGLAGAAAGAAGGIPVRRADGGGGPARVWFTTVSGGPLRVKSGNDSKSNVKSTSLGGAAELSEDHSEGQFGGQIAASDS